MRDFQRAWMGDFVKIEVIMIPNIFFRTTVKRSRRNRDSGKRRVCSYAVYVSDLNAARDLVNAGAACVMPLGSPIGSIKGNLHKNLSRY